MSIETLCRYAALTREGERTKVKAQIEDLNNSLQIVEYKIERLTSGEAHKS